MKKLLLTGLCVLTLVSVTGCGQKGPLVPPPAAAVNASSPL